MKCSQTCMFIRRKYLTFKTTTKIAQISTSVKINRYAVQYSTEGQFKTLIFVFPNLKQWNMYYIWIFFSFIAINLNIIIYFYTDSMKSQAISNEYNSSISGDVHVPTDQTHYKPSRGICIEKSFYVSKKMSPKSRNSVKQEVDEQQTQKTHTTIWDHHLRLHAYQISNAYNC